MKRGAIKIPELLRASGLRVTKQREAILALLVASSKPLAVETITSKAESRLDLATAYRALQEFERLNLVRRVLLPGGRALYEMVGEHHHHVTCRNCGAIEDVEVCLPPHINRSLSRKARSFARIEEHALEFFGTCRSCYASA